MNLEQTKNIDRLVNEKLGDEQNVEQLATLDNINRVQARKPKTNRDKKGKKTFSLFGIYSDVKISLAQAETVVLEYVQIVDGQVVLNPTGEALQKVSKEAAELINEAVVLYQEVRNKSDQIKAQWIKEKVINNRYTRRGFEIVQEFQNVGDAVFTLNSICVGIQAIVTNLVIKMEQTESE